MVTSVCETSTHVMHIRSVWFLDNWHICQVIKFQVIPWNRTSRDLSLHKVRLWLEIPPIWYFGGQVVLTIFDFAWNEYTRDAYTLSLVLWYWQICQVMKFQDKRISFYRTYLCLGIRLWKQVSAKRVHTWCIYAQSAGSLILAHVSGYEVSRQKVFFYINV